MNEIPIEQAKELLIYCPSSPSGLVWSSKRGSSYDGKIAGYKNSKGYYCVTIKNKEYRTHRVVCQLHGLQINGMEIDHIDGNKSNNLITNLRVVSSKENNRNRGLTLSNKSGFAGVMRWVYASGNYAWKAYWRENGKSKTKSFCVEKYGEWGAFALACEARKEGLKNLVGEHKHTERHVFSF